MESFRTATAARAHDQGVLTAADRPDWLADGETVTYWRRLPHGAARRVAAAATPTTYDEAGKPHRTFDLDAATGVQMREGIVDWTILDETRQRVAWDPSRADALLARLPPAVTAPPGLR